jgi:hypothetical protein
MHDKQTITPYKTVVTCHDSWSGREIVRETYHPDEHSARRDAKKVNSKNTLNYVPETYYTAEVIINKEWAKSIEQQQPGYWAATT